MPDRSGFEDPIVAFEVPVFRKLQSLDQAGIKKLASTTRLSTDRLIQLSRGAKPTAEELKIVTKSL